MLVEIHAFNPWTDWTRMRAFSDSHGIATVLPPAQLEALRNYLNDAYAGGLGSFDNPPFTPSGGSALDVQVPLLTHAAARAF